MAGGLVYGGVAGELDYRSSGLRYGTLVVVVVVCVCVPRQTGSLITVSPYALRPRALHLCVLRAPAGWGWRTPSTVVGSFRAPS